MGRIKKFKLGGVDLKSNDLVRDQMKASNSRNCTKTTKGDIDKRNGYELTETISAELEETIYHKSYNDTILVKSDGTFHKLYNGARQDCSIATLATNVGLTLKNRIVSTEYLSSLYFTTSDGLSDVIKYDGSNAYLAGMPAPLLKFDGTDTTPASAGSGNYYYRIFYGHKDLNGNLTFGPYLQLRSTTATITITTSTFKNLNPYGDFFDKYLTAPGGQPPVTFANPKLNYTATNYVAGDYFLADGETDQLTVSSNSGITFKKVRIVSIAAGVITFDPNDLTDLNFAPSFGPSSNIDSRSRLYVFRSSNESFGYKCVSSQVESSAVSRIFVLNNSQDNIAQITLDPPYDHILFEDLYNEDGEKIRPPKCKYLTAYNDQLIFGNIVGLWDQLNNFSQFNNDDIMAYSDFGIGDNGENNSANVEKIGESFDGEITGLRRCNDLLVVTKSNGLFAFNGLLEPGGFTSRRVPTNYIGCTSHNSILEIDGGLMFQGNDGIYFTNGVSCQKVSDELDPFFETIDGTKTKSTVNIKNDKFIFYVTDNTNHYALAFDYHFKEWFIWDSLDMSKGVYQNNSNDLFFSKGTGIYKFNTGYSDAGAAITAYYASNWEDLQEPSLDKKFKYVRIWNLNSSSTAYNLVIQKNWTDTDQSTVAVSLSANSTVQKAHDQKTYMAIRYIFKNSTINQNMLITGYEIEYEGLQSIDKGN